MDKSQGGARFKTTTQRSLEEKNDEKTEPPAEDEGEEKNMPNTISSDSSAAAAVARSTQSDSEDDEKNLETEFRDLRIRDATSVKVLQRTNATYPSITYHNPTSVAKKLDALNEEKFETDIIAICETWLKSDHTNRALDDKYEGFFCDRKEGKKKKGGGCAIWLRKLDCKKREIVFSDTGTDEMQIESICVKFKYKKENFAVLIIYNPPGNKRSSRSSHNMEMTKKMFEDCKKHTIPQYNFIVMGDFNRTTLGTTRQLGSEERHLTLYGKGKSELDQIYGTNPDNPYTQRLLDPSEYNTGYKEKKKEEHMIIQLY